VLAQLRKLAVSASLAHKFDREAWKQQLGRMLNLWESLSRLKELFLAAPRPKSREEEWSPTDSFVVYENGKALELVP